MSNTDKDTTTTLEVVPSTPTPVVPQGPSVREQTENTLNYLNAAYSLLQNGLFIGKDSNILIQVKAWLENQQKALQLQLAKAIASDADKAGQ